MRTYTKLEQTCMIETDLLHSISIHFYLAFGSSREGSVTKGADIQKGLVSVTQMRRYLIKQILKVIIQLQLICFFCFSYAVDNHAGFHTGNRVNHDPVLFTDTEHTD